MPVASQGVVALSVAGDPIEQIATFLPTAGRWFPIDLKEPAKGQVSPVVVNNQAVYTIGRRVYAFSGPMEKWDVVELPEGARPAPIVYPNRATVEHDGHIYVFSVKTGKWTDFDAGSGQVRPTDGK